MTIEVALLISVLSVSFSIFFGLKNNKRNDDDELKQRVQRDTIVNIKLDDISSDIKDIKYDVSLTKKEISTLAERVATVESSSKQAHHRLDRLENVKKESDTQC